MSSRMHPLDVLRRRRTAADAAGESPSLAERPVPAAEACRCGVAKIASNTGSGAYTITEQWWIGGDNQSGGIAFLRQLDAKLRPYASRFTGGDNDTGRHSRSPGLPPIGGYPQESSKWIST